MVRKLIFLFVCSLLAIQNIGWAQVSDAERKYSAYEMRSNGKIYVVVAVVLIILIGLLAYLVRLDRKISRLEKETR